MGLGAGAIKANVSPMIAEQYTGKLRKETLPSGEVVIKSPAVTIQSIYMWFYAAINFGSCGAISASFLARDHGYWAAYLVPTCIFALVPGVLILGRKNYVVTPPRGSVLLEVSSCFRTDLFYFTNINSQTIRVVNYSLAPIWSFNPVRTINGIRSPDFWAPSKPSSYEPGKVPKGITWDDEFVGEVSRTISACQVFLFFPFFWLCKSTIFRRCSVLYLFFLSFRLLSD